MKKILVISLISLIMLTSLTAAFTQQVKKEVDINMDSLKGIIYRKTDQGFFEFFRIQVWTRLLDNATIKKGDTIKTASNSQLTLDIGGNNKVELREETVLKLGENLTSAAQKFKVEKGRVLFNTNLDPELEFDVEIETAHAIIKSDRAILTVEVNEYRTLLSVRQGEVTLTEKTTLTEAALNENQLAIVKNNEIRKYERTKE